jgi:type VII secretion-associated serine protease mycosin
VVVRLQEIRKRLLAGALAACLVVGATPIGPALAGVPDPVPVDVAAPKATTLGSTSLASTTLAAEPVGDKGLGSSTWSAADTDADSVLVVFDEPQTAAQQAEFAKRSTLSGGAVEKWSASGDAVLARTLPGSARWSFACSAAADDAVRWTQPEVEYEASWTPNDAYYASQWGLPRIGAPAAWETTRGSSSVVVAVVDTGVDLDHPDLASRIDVADGYDFVGHSTVANDDNGHGTHVAGIVAATANNAVGVAGTAPDCRILPVKVLDASGRGSTLDVADGIRWAVAKGAEVINLSLASTAADSYTRSAVAYALAANVVVVAAAGNDGSSAGASYPAAYPGVVGVGASNAADTRASFSNYGSGLDVTAPGVDIMSTETPLDRGLYYGEKSGTSMASPFVAGVAALVRSQNPSVSPSRVAAHLQATAEDLGSPGFDYQYGWGLVRADLAVQTPIDTDGDIPGVTLPTSPVSGSLTAQSDRADVYRVRIDSGQRLSVTLNGASGTDFDIYLFGPSSASIYTSNYLAVSMKATYPDAFAYSSASTADYYVVVYQYSGSGTYELEWSIAASPPGDESNIPGIALPPSPVSDSLTQASDENDVFKVYLAAGQAFDVTLGGATGTDFDLYLYAPDAIDIAFDVPVASSESSAYPDEIAYTAVATGFHYLRVSRWSGTGSYQLDWSITGDATSDPDENIPGIVLPASPFSDSLASTSDVRDVFRVALTSGQALSVELTAAPTTDYDLHLFGPAATDVLTDIPVASSIGAVYPERVAFRATETGDYYVSVARVSGSGPYSLTWGITSDPDGEMPGVVLPASPVAGGLAPVIDEDDVYQLQLSVGDRLSVEMTGPAVTDFDLYLYGPAATSLRSAPLAVSTHWTYPETLTWTATEPGRYCIDVRRFSGTGVYELRWSAVQQVPSSLSAPRASTSRPRRGRSVTFSARIAPAAAAVSAGCTLSLYRWEIKTVRKKVRGRWRRVRVRYWRLRGSVAMTPDASGLLTARARPRYAGKWRAKVTFSGSADYMPSTSGTRTFYVR